MKKLGRLEIALLLLIILLGGFYFRFVGLGWGEGQHIHPDEEFLRQVTAAVQLPDRLAIYFDAANSPLNPYNRGHGFFVYGTLPLFVTRAVAEGLDRGCQAAAAGQFDLWTLPARWLSPALLGRPLAECGAGFFTGGGVRMVGRALAALFDLAAVAFVFLAGRRLHSRWVGLLAAALYALAAMPIQQSHFYTVDAFANLFAAATLYLALRAAQTGGWGSFALAGLTTGLGMACKISLWPLGLLVAVAGGVLLWEGEKGTGRQEDRGKSLLVTLLPLLQVALAGVIAFSAFRAAQPYAFQGPGFFGLQLNEQWMNNMAEIRRQVSGAVDLYHGHQWADRTPLLFPWKNMVVWGLGLPLGLAAWAGWGGAGISMVRRWRRGEGRTVAASPQTSALFLTWLWGTGYFVYQGAQWVKSMRYLLPVYPAFVLLAAWFVVRLWEWSQRPARGVLGGRRWPSLRRWLGVVLAALVLVGTLCWAFALTSVYTRSHPRIAATRWVFENVPTAATVHLRTAEGAAQLQLTISHGSTHPDNTPAIVPFRVEQEADLDGVTLNYVVDPNGDPERELIRVAVASDAAGETVLAAAEGALDAPLDYRGQPFAVTLAPVRLLPGATYYLVVEVLSGGPVQLFTSVLGTEHWDWPPPLRLDGHDPFGGMYRGLSTSSDGTMQLYYDDTFEKREQLLNWLEEADYIIIASNRLYASIPRLASRYPLTIAYYEALFSGELGFDLVADFTSYMSLGPFQFPDTEEPFAIPAADYQYRAGSISIPLPPAEEAFSVYDHPRVLIFCKRDDYSRMRAEELLGPDLLRNVVWVSAGDAGRRSSQPDGVEKRDAVLPPEVWAEQRAGGTWAEMFDRDSLLNRSEVLAALAWYLALAVLGLFAFPLLFAALPRLPDRGYGLARAFGLLLVAYLTWLAASLHVLPNSRGTILLMTLLLAIGGGLAAWRQWPALRDFLRQRGEMVVFYEAVFFLLFVVWAWVRSRNPDLWHMYVGGEKPMDFAYLNAVIKSTWFPPYDPWFAGGYINYYYFGFVLVSTLVKLLGIVPSVAYNLTLALFYALTGGAAFSVAFNLVRAEGSSRRPYYAGLLAILLVLILGNLGEARLLVKGFRLLAGDVPFESTIPGLAQFVQMVKGLGMALRGAALPLRLEAPYWEPTRVIPADASGVGPITEFPAFTFLYGDPHAHMFAMPYTIFAIALALNWARGLNWRSLLSLPVGGLVIGALWVTNTWDYPTYLLLGLAGLALGWLSRPLPGDRRDGGRKLPLPAVIGCAVVLVALTLLFFLPYTRHYVAAYTTLHGWTEPRTSFKIYWVLHGQFLFPLLTLLAIDLWWVWRRFKPLPEVKAPPAGEDEGETAAPSRAITPAEKQRLLLLGLGGLLVIGLALSLLVPAALVAAPMVVLALALVLDPEAPVERRLVWLMVAGALALTLAVEVVVLEGDIGRMNTVFKFYNQVWILLAVSTAAALVWLLERMSRWPIEAWQAWWVAMGALVAATALFPALAIPAKLQDRFHGWTGPTLDGMAYMEYAVAYDPRGEVDMGRDYAAITWMQENISGSPVILEGLAPYEYLWGNRVSVYTGLPAVVGWRWHQVQQRMAGSPSAVEQRHLQVAECYSTTDVARALEILRQYNVRYIYVGPYEEISYPTEGLAKFEAMAASGLLRRVYDFRGVRIYELPE
ncbi:MAG: glycosyltransferase family 39 protein [Anaerolineae bacterium]|nr:glycosyltransferase family 39 protein [Anaerolineae bacterium]